MTPQFLILVIFIFCLPSPTTSEPSPTPSSFSLNPSFLISLDALNVTHVVDRFHHLKTSLITPDLTSSDLTSSSNSRAKRHSRRRQKRRETACRKLLTAYGFSPNACKIMRTKQTPLKKLIKQFKKLEKMAIQAAKESMTCLVPDEDLRRQCCREKYGPIVENERENKYWWHRFTCSWYMEQQIATCMAVYDTVAKGTIEISTALQHTEEVELETDLNDTLSILPDELRPDTIVYELVRTEAVEAPDENITRLMKRRHEVDQMTVQNADKLPSLRLNTFLFDMKKEEINLYAKRERSRGLYAEFMNMLYTSYKSKGTGVFYSSEEKTFMTCVLVQYRNESISSYCAFLWSIDPYAKEFGRGPVWGWEIGAKDKMEKKSNWNTNVITRSGMEEEDMPSHVRSMFVDLYGDRSGCREVNLAFACHSFCCDSYFAYSQFCQTSNLRCFG